MSGAPFRTTRHEALRLSLTCELDSVRPVSVAVAAFLREQLVAEGDIQSCELALVEGCNNAIHYATTDGQRQPVEVEVLCDGAAIEVRVHDHTAGFEWPETIGLPEPDQESGRGLYLMHCLMDDVRYLRGRGRNCLVLRKTRQVTRELVFRSEAMGLAADRKLVESEQIISDMAEELSFCYESLSAIFRCSAELGKTRNLEGFSLRLLTDLSQITSADWFVLRLVAKEDSRLVVFTASEPSLQLVPLVLGGSGSTSVELEAALARQDVWCDEERRLDGGDPLGAARAGSLALVHPFFVGDSLIGTLAMGKAAGGPHFTAVHANVIHTFADFLAIQIVNARFQEEQVVSRVVSRELEIARNIQRSLLPKSLPMVPGYTLAGFCESARQVGGDFYDVLRIDDRSLLLIIADVMGKGIPAAIFAAILRSLLRAVPEWTSDPAALLGRVNRLLYDELSGVDMFITAQVIFVDLEAQRLVGASAGHCPTFFGGMGEPCVRTISPEGLPLGILAETSFANQTETLRREQRVLLYTDGLTEARNPQGEFFGQERLLRWFEKSLSERRSAEELRDELAAELIDFQASGSLKDDQTFLIMAS